MEQVVEWECTNSYVNSNPKCLPGIKYGYARVSTDDQHIEVQVKLLENNGIPRLNIFSDIVSSYKNIEHRKNLDFLIGNMKEGDSITVVRLDRIARSTKELLAIMELVKSKGCSLHSLNEDINTEGHLGTLFITMLAAIKDFERGLIKERSKEGIEKAKANGKYKGRTKTFPSHEIKKIKTLIKNGVQISHIAKMYDCSRTTIYRYIRENDDEMED